MADMNTHFKTPNAALIFVKLCATASVDMGKLMSMSQRAKRRVPRATHVPTLVPNINMPLRERYLSRVDFGLATRHDMPLMAFSRRNGAGSLNRPVIFCNG